MPGRKARRNAPVNPTRAELPPEIAAQLRKIGDNVYCMWSAPVITAVLAQMPGKKSRKSTMRSPSPSPTRVSADLKDECAQLRRIGDKLNFRQKLLNFISKLFNLVT
ncbi:phorbol-12-myristate-13-acetate-induced protein 1 [Arvicanthis niloticus]|uniref:phorbol-12-myristate-13-acetate-induced protein 1 n=1 Tax=Arvicanthis niloticus TaxID=61156 RepID=UPI0014871FA0|nr:phorbol-12-myristate-13-acetate-induced protein 1 [Arvicanthis niloticus]